MCKREISSSKKWWETNQKVRNLEKFKKENRIHRKKEILSSKLIRGKNKGQKPKEVAKKETKICLVEKEEVMNKELRNWQINITKSVWNSRTYKKMDVDEGYIKETWKIVNNYIKLWKNET